MFAETSPDAFWGMQTAKSNFCEQDYAVTRYIAEFVNSLTNLVYIFYAIYGLRKLRQKSNHDVFRAIPYWGLMAVGICSAAFHISLKYHTQMLDDLSMLFTTTPVLHQVLTVNATRRNSLMIAILLWSSLLSLVVYHVRTDELLLHSLSFAAMVIVIGIRTMQLINAQTLPGSAARKQIWGMVRFGAVIFNLGFYLWLIDTWICAFLRSTRARIGLPLAFLLELHGWWHIFTGIGAYIFIAVVDHLVSGVSHDAIEESFAWPASWASRSVFAGRDPEVAHKKQS
ncbi:alkaline phytoceramidase [Aspergillus nomiae NRRL 13137]|uniref:Alkaline phytoceramidase n=1 Tax=Aspergillus nomiae NRRL (strain ATCC 15546 / NRRL 13137 / CBS 260.88 / M93) TaxID=1509407 RepID=A0A0L1J869_ASPN3|nr:alkaline phytoceramidase [Aspergillus nomiae NRRL 13137]KNG87618.1 alkaline phytoceramidase [Aspergillus nomiae NRRL 13137]